MKTNFEKNRKKDNLNKKFIALALLVIIRQRQC